MRCKWLCIIDLAGTVGVMIPPGQNCQTVQFGRAKAPNLPIWHCPAKPHSLTGARQKTARSGGCGRALPGGQSSESGSAPKLGKIG